jgi:hypothetical protein
MNCQAFPLLSLHPLRAHYANERLTATRIDNCPKQSSPPLHSFDLHLMSNVAVVSLLYQSHARRLCSSSLIRFGFLLVSDELLEILCELKFVFSRKADVLPSNFEVIDGSQFTVGY